MPRRNTVLPEYSLSNTYLFQISIRMINHRDCRHQYLDGVLEAEHSVGSLDPVARPGRQFELTVRVLGLQGADVDPCLPQLGVHLVKVRLKVGQHERGKDVATLKSKLR